MSKIFDAFIPSSANAQAQARARVLVTTCLSIGLAVIAMLLYWIIPGWLEDIETVAIGLTLILILAGILALVKRGHVRAAAWTLTILMALLSLADMSTSGMGTTSSSALLIPIALAAFTLGPAVGLVAAILGSAAVFAIALAGSAGWLQTAIPFQQSNLSFDAITLTLVYLLVGALCAVWSKAANAAFGESK